MKNELKGLGKIFAFTFERQVKSTGYLVGTIVFALLCFLLPAGIMAAVEYFGGDSDSAVETAAVSPVQTVYVADETDGAADWNLLTQAGSETFGGISYVTCGSLEEADAQAGQEEHSLILLLEEAKKTAQENTLSQASNGSQNGYQMHLLLPDNTSLSEGDAGDLESFLQANFQIILLQKSGIDPAAAAELLVPATTEVTTFGEEALSETEAALESMREVLGMLLPYLNIMILYFLVLFYGQGVANNVIMEKTSKLMDTFLVAVKPTAMVFGKVLAVTAASMLQFVIVAASLIGGFAAGSALVRMIDPDSDMLLLLFFDSLSEFQGVLTVPGILLAVVMMVSGFFLYCSLSAIGGSAAGKPEDLSSTNVVFTTVLIVSFLAALYAGGIGSMDSGAFAKWLDFVPFTSILVTPSRIMLGEVSLGMGFVSLLLVLIVSVLCLLLAGKVYRMMALYKGNPPTPAKLMKMLKEK
ncbi:ABC transporter permease [Lacrimispora saccharolytica]|nr:ABC transporter permease [Lacrimispora saccharolytica]